MKTRHLFVAAATVLLAAGLVHSSRPVSAQGAAALTGTVSSMKEGKMEGVLVIARLDGGNFDVTVVSDAQGRYSFPRSHVPPGTYSISIRALGFDLGSKNTIEVPEGKTATLDLSLVPHSDLSTQITSAEWMMSIPGTDEQKVWLQRNIMTCTYCHSLELTVKSKHNAEQFIPLINRMQSFFPDGSAYGREGRGRAVVAGKNGLVNAEKNPNWGSTPGVKKTDLAGYLASINMSAPGRTLPALKTLPRPKGKATKVIITRWDTPRKDVVSHDGDVDSKGNFWYTDQSRMFVGMLNPKTGAFTEWEIPPAMMHEYGGGADVQVGKDDKIYFPATNDKFPSHFGPIVQFDPKTEKFTWSDMPAAVQFITIGPTDGKIWGGGGGVFYRIDPATMKVDWNGQWNKSPNLPPGPHPGYEMAVDPKGNPYVTDYGSSNIIRMDVNTKEVKAFPTPTPKAMPRRGQVDLQGRYWFAEYTGDKIGMFDTNTEKMQEWAPSMPWAAPYTASLPDSRGHVYAPSNMTDRIYRLDAKTGEVVEYLMPGMDFDVKQVSIIPTGNKRGAIMSSVRDARVLRIEPTD